MDQKPKALSKIDEVRNQFKLMEPQFKLALPPQVTVEKFNRVCITAIQGNPALLDANRQTLYSAVMKCAADGLLPDGREAALVKYGDRVQYMPMIYGVLKKVRQSGEISSIAVHVVHQADEFEVWTDEKGDHLMYRPALTADRGAATHGFAVVVTKDEGSYIEVMPHEEIEQVRKSSKSGNSGPWVQWWGEMAKKTVLRRLAKRLPSSTDIEKALSADDDLDDGGGVNLKSETNPQKVEGAKSSRLKGLINAKAERIVEEVPPEEAQQETENDEELPI